MRLLRVKFPVSWDFWHMTARDEGTELDKDYKKRQICLENLGLKVERCGNVD